MKYLLFVLLLTGQQKTQNSSEVLLFSKPNYKVDPIAASQLSPRHKALVTINQTLIPAKSIRLRGLSEVFFTEVVIEKAFNYIPNSREDTILYIAKLHTVGVSSSVAKLSNAFELIIQEQKYTLKKQSPYISILSILLVAALLFILKLYKNIKQLKRKVNTAHLGLKNLTKKLSRTNKELEKVKNELSHTNHIREQHLGTFMNLYSDGIDKLDSYRRMMRKNILNNKTNELLEITKSKEFIHTELMLFYTNFDKSFLNIYPRFIEKVNTLLLADQQIQMNKSEILNTELRILALIKLGITNSIKIAKILRYSVNTIYNYRVRIKNSALKRDEFEELIRKIV